jgi:hypothetical protein
LGDLLNEFHCLIHPILVVLAEAAAGEKHACGKT